MIQRISVRVVLRHRESCLLVRRADGRSSILGKYELPGGRVVAGEQPEDAAGRFLREDIGMPDAPELRLEDVLTYEDADDREIQYAVVVYSGEVSEVSRAVSLSSHYDKFVWYQAGKLDPGQITELGQLLLGVVPPVTDGAQKADTGRIEMRPTVYSDGGSRGNPGPSATGYVLVDAEGMVIDEGGEYLGITTNNQAEYQGVKLGLEKALAMGWRDFDFKVDSMLVANQLNGVYKVKNRELWPIHDHIKELLSQFDRVRFIHVPRELNQLADGMVNKILNQHIRKEK